MNRAFQKARPALFRAGRALAAPLLTAGLLFVVYAAFGLFPFGEKSLSWCDMNQQVVPLTAEFRGILLGEGSMLRSGAAGGINFWGIFFFFLASPFSLLAVFVKPEHLPWFMNLLVLLKMALCAGTGSLLFRRLSGGEKSVPPALMGVLYAFSGYALLYYQNIVWLDMMALFPLLLLALRELEARQRVLPFVLVFSAMLAVNYYLSYMVVLFLLFAGGLWLLQDAGARRGRTALLLGFGAVLSLLLTAVVWLPSLLEVLRSARGDGLAEGLRAGSLGAQIFTTLPTIFTAALPFAALFFLRRKRLRAGLFWAAAVMALLFLIPMLVAPINKMWHTGSYQGFPTRYGYMAGFLLLLLSFWIVREIAPREIPARSRKAAVAILGAAAAGYGFLTLWMLANHLPVFSAYSRTLWGDQDSFFSLLGMLLAAAAVFTLLLGFWQNGVLSRRVFTGAAAVLILTEAFFNAGVYIGAAPTDQQNAVRVLSLTGEIEEDGFFRVKTARKYFDVNLLSAAGYETLAHYTSLTPETTLLTQRRLGYSGYWMEVGSHGGTAFSDALLANEYEIFRTEEGYAFRALPYDLPDAVVTGAEPGFLETLPAASRMEIQQAVANALFPDAEGLFFLCQPDSLQNLTVSDGEYYVEGGETGRITWRVAVGEPVTLYFDCAAAPSNALSESVNKSCTIIVNGRVFRREYPAQSENGILCLGSFADETVEISVELSKSIAPESFELFGLREEVLASLCETAQGAELEGGGSRFALSCTAKEGQTLFVPLSWDEGWRAYVNGEEVPLSRAAGNYLSLPLSAGENEVELRYFPPGLKTGMLLSLGGLLLLYPAVRLAGSLSRSRAAKRAALLLFYAAAIGAAAVVYIVPVVIYFAG